MGAFADGVVGYAQAGWPCIIPVPALDKFPPPNGFTGADGRDSDPLQLVQWATDHADHSIALRMPDGVIGLDIDHYDKEVLQPDQSVKVVRKRGGDTIAKLEADWGPLPPTWISTARGSTAGPGPSGIRFFRVPAIRFVSKLTDVEIIQRHHRYAVVAPSFNTEAGAPYVWYDPTHHASHLPPKPLDLPELPEEWIKRLSEGAAGESATASDPVKGTHLLEQLVNDSRPECVEIADARSAALLAARQADQGSRHDTMTAALHRLVQLSAGGHTGAGPAFAQLEAVWADLTAGEGRQREFVDMLHTSARKAVTVVGENQVPRDPCILDRGFLVDAAAPGDARPPAEGNTDLGEALEPPRWWSVREAVGAEPFLPQSGLDQVLAQNVLDRMRSALRYAYDSNGWLLRSRERWELMGNMTSWAVAEMGWLMPRGDATAPAGSPEHELATMRARFLSHKGAQAVAGKMTSLVMGGVHPAAVKLGALDAEPWALWAGGMPYDLRASADGPVYAAIDPNTPHLHSTGVVPERRPTPLWDAFVAAVWPDPEVRAWALRVLSISLTGYPDRALPIMQGEKGRGKTSVVVLLMSALGTYAHAANPKLLGATDTHDTILYDLKGRRLSFIDEGPREGKLGQERLKQITGGAALTANRMRQDPITFNPTHTLVMTANDPPELTDAAVRDRVRLIPCNGDPEAVRATRQAIGHLNSPQWRNEAPGVLALFMSESAKWLADQTTGRNEEAPVTIRYIAEEIAAEQDPVAAWLEEEVEAYPPGTAVRALYASFQAFCLAQGMRRDLIPTVVKWGRELTRRGYPSSVSRIGQETPKVRPLRVKTYGSYTPVTYEAPPEAQVSGSEPFVSGSNGPETQPETASDQPIRSNVSDVSGSNATHSTLTHRPAPRCEGLTGESPETATPETETVGDEPVTVSVKPETATERKRREKAEAKSLAIREAAGPRVPLPAVVVRQVPGVVPSVSPITVADADALLATITNTPDQALTVDVETSGYPVGHDLYELRTVQLGNDAFAVVFDPAEHADPVRRHLAAAPFLHAHSSPADLVPLTRAGLLDWTSAWDRMHDTVIPAKLADPQSTGSDPGLKKLADAVLRDEATSTPADVARKALFKAAGWLTDTEPTTPIERSGWAQVDHHSTTMLRYDGSDVLDTAALAKRLPSLPPEILQRERIAQRATARITLDGLPLDGDHVDRLHAEHTEGKQRLGDLIRADYGVDNPGSARQVADKLTEMGVRLPRTAPSHAHPEGQASVAAGVLEPLKGTNALIDTILDYRHHATALSLFLETFSQLVHHGDGRVRSTIYTLGTDTGRMSSSRFNLQQLSREGGIRACITADPGYKLISADFKSVEICVAAALSQDPTLMAMLADGVDPHAMAAAQVFGPDWTKGNRYSVKRGVFGRIYGGGAPTLAKQMGVPLAVAQALIDTIDRLWPVLTDWSGNIRDAIGFGQTTFTAYSGRVIHLPVDAAYAAPNYCIQGTARELLVDALIRWVSTHWGDSILFPVHDEVVAMVRESEADDATATLAQCMASNLNGVAIVADPSAPAFAWQDAA